MQESSAQKNTDNVNSDEHQSNTILNQLEVSPQLDECESFKSFEDSDDDESCKREYSDLSINHDEKRYNRSSNVSIKKDIVIKPLFGKPPEGFQQSNELDLDLHG